MGDMVSLRPPRRKNEVALTRSSQVQQSELQEIDRSD
jgi:hypothetical protein